MFPQDNPNEDKTKVSHIDILEAVLPFESLEHHWKGEHCRRRKLDIVCREPGCGVKIWVALFKSYSTVEEEQAIYKLNNNRRKEKFLNEAYLSLVAFFSGEVKLVLHRDGQEGSHVHVAWLKKKESMMFDDSPNVNLIKLHEARQIRGTVVPKNVTPGNNEEDNEKCDNDEDEFEDEEQHQDFLPDAVSTPKKQKKKSPGSPEDSSEGPTEDNHEDHTEHNYEDHTEDNCDGHTEDNYEGNDGSRTDQASTNRGAGGHTSVVEDEHQSWCGALTECDICHYRGRSTANHLRESMACLEQFRSRLPLQVTGRNDAAIIKISLIIGECPNPDCESGRHIAMPQRCVEWWKGEGGIILGWKGLTEDSDANSVNEKIHTFLKNFKSRRETATLQTGGPSRRRVEKCASCNEYGPLIPHLSLSKECLSAHVEHHLPKDYLLDNEGINRRRSIFLIAAVMNECANPHCPGGEKSPYLAVHLDRNLVCLEFYREEGVLLSLSNWDQAFTSRVISKRISALKRNLKEKKQKENMLGYTYFEQELSKVLNHHCSTCAIMGPVPGVESSTMMCIGANQYGIQLWRCLGCLGSTETLADVVESMKAESQRLQGDDEGGFGLKEDLRKNRAVFGPLEATHNYEENNPTPTVSTVMLVPRLPTALKTIATLCDKALEQKTDLLHLSEKILNRPIVMDFQDTFRCLYRNMLANIKGAMGKIYIALSNVAVGEVLSENPNLTNARKRTPKVGMTFSGALREACHWSVQSEEKRSAEHEARTHINGLVKIYVKGTLLEGFEDVHLNKILLVGCQVWVNPYVQTIEEIQRDPAFHSIFLNKMAPIILKYIHVKFKLLVKHIIAPNFNNHDLRLKFHEGSLRVQVEGFVYARQFEDVNQLISRATNVRILPGVVNSILASPEVLPTVTLDWRELMENYQIEEIRARAIIELVHQKQVQDAVSPPSLLNMCTPPEYVASTEEKLLRGRVLDLSKRNSDKTTLEAIVEMTLTLREEGLFEELQLEQIDPQVRSQMKAQLSELAPDESESTISALAWYHCFLLMTGGSNQWTLKRKCGEIYISPYHPILLEALKQTVEVRVSVSMEHLDADYGRSPNEDDEDVLSNYAWREVSILEFLHGVSKHGKHASQATVAIISSQEQEKRFTSSNEKDEEVDDVFVNTRDETFIITNGDLRKQYSKRPLLMENMTFAQFITGYYRLQSKQKAVIDPHSDVGEDSDIPIVGGDGRCPLYMRLSNKIMMKMRGDDSKVVPLMLQSKSLDSYAERLLFGSWRRSEELINDVSEEDKMVLKQNRLALFPTSCFPRPSDD